MNHVSPEEGDLTTSTTRLERAGYLVELGRWTEALRESTAALAAEPDSFEGHCLLGACLVALGEHERALDAAETAIRLCPDDEWGHLVRSSALGHLGRHEEAEVAAREAVRLEPDDPLTHARLAKALLALPDRAAAAQTSVERALALDPDRVATHLLVAQVADALGDGEAERAAYHRVLQLDPQNAEAVTGLAALDSEHVRFDSALRHAAGALSLDPTEAVYRENLETIGRNLVALGVIFIWVAVVPLAALAAVGTMGIVDLWWVRGIVGLAVVPTYAVVLGRTLRNQPANVRRFLRRTIVGLPVTEPRFTFLLVVPAWSLLAGAALLPAPAAIVASALLVALFVAVRSGYPDRPNAD